ncbi:MAG TPA: hypothetical protein VKW08_27110 [Xanthobacteraceae bacterium]|jgi:hypothetical protein|nr:hypothetical protein [Xanthobacteraceae bacterium]
MHHRFAATLLLALATSATAQGLPTRLEVWDLKLGTPVDKLPDEFVDYACGTNGGPPSLPLAGFGEFHRCRAEASGLREVYFRYDDELEYWAKANSLEDQMEQYAGTKTYGFPVVVSALIDAQGILRGIRIVSDPRDPSQNRDEAYLLRNFLNARFGREDWQCQDLPLAEGETAVDGVFVKQDCRKQIDATTSATLQTRYLRKPGQARFDPHSGRETEGQFESSARFELVQKP